MRKAFLFLSLGLLLVLGLYVAGSAQAPAPAPATSYLTPPKVIADIMDVVPLPGVSVSPDRTKMLLSYRRSMATIAEVSAPFHRLAGSRINPRTNGPRSLNGPTRMVLKDMSTGAERNLLLPQGGTYMALKGFGATVRYVTLPYEAHGYAAAQSNKHVVTETLNWLDKYVKNAGPRPAQER